MKHILLTTLTVLIFSIMIITVYIKATNNVPYIITHQDNEGYYHAEHMENGSTIVFLLSDDAENDTIRAIGTLVQVKSNGDGKMPLITKWEEN